MERTFWTILNGRISAEILPEAIEQKLFWPFQYFGVSDDVDLFTVRWTRGEYDKNEVNYSVSYQSI